MNQTSKPSYSVPVHGNYHGYYQKRQSDLDGDERLALLPNNFFSGKRVLDVGCNEGYVTCEIAQKLGAQRVVGVDIDAELVALAWKRRRHLWSLQKPGSGNQDSKPSTSTTTDGSKSRTGKRKRQLEHEEVANGPVPGDMHYFPSALQHMFGPLPLPKPPATPSAEPIFPHNVSFVTTDWAGRGSHLDKDGYDVVLALSVTKWIHLNDGDAGIRAFFRRVNEVLRPGGSFVLEIQPSDSYHKARRMHPKLKAAVLELKPEQFGDELTQLGFSESELTGDKTEGGGFKRPLRLYTKPRI